MTEGHFNVKRAPALDNEGRLRELRIDQLLTEVAGIKSGMICLDLGSGTGAFSYPMINHVGQEGTVYAVDESNEMLDYARQKNPPANLQLINRDASGTGLEGEIGDFCLLAFLIHEVDKHGGLISETYRLLKTGGKVLIVEWKEELDSPGPPRKVRLAEKQVRQLFDRAGFKDFEYIDWTVNTYLAVGTK